MNISQVYHEFEDLPTFSLRRSCRNSVSLEKNNDEWRLRKMLPKSLQKKYKKLSKRK
ncbi:MAG: hypothetical protein OQK82_08955 [Candidatus Pacearchaeota archaeon]|nr:hypothetical protein [Candidatus Pacearchaeota archaeon]